MVNEIIIRKMVNQLPSMGLRNKTTSLLDPVVLMSFKSNFPGKSAVSHQAWLYMHIHTYTMYMYIT